MLGLDGWDEYTDGWWRETPRVVSPWSASEWKQPLHVEDADALRRRRRRTDGVCWARGPDSSTAQYRSETSSPPSSMLGQFLVVVTFTSLRPPTQARQKRPGSREETVFAVRHEQPFNRSNQREAVCLRATPRTDRGRGSSRRSDEGKWEVLAAFHSTIKLCCYRRTGPLETGPRPAGNPPLSTVVPNLQNHPLETFNRHMEVWFWCCTFV